MHQALLDAAGLVDLNVLSLIDENAAAALQLAINMSPAELEALKSSDNGGKVVLFYNMGATRLQVRRWGLLGTRVYTAMGEK